MRTAQLQAALEEETALDVAYEHLLGRPFTIHEDTYLRELEAREAAEIAMKQNPFGVRCRCVSVSGRGAGCFVVGGHGVSGCGLGMEWAGCVAVCCLYPLSGWGGGLDGRGWVRGWRGWEDGVWMVG